MEKILLDDIKKINPEMELNKFFSFIANNENYPNLVDEMISIALGIEEATSDLEKQKLIQEFKKLQSKI